ncbi:uncharacterized protein LOC117570935 isoform X1 [Drosophila albomicans]|uniref:Uncharacterized protein LOC117570935 isoform X1 n=1 Tax=Drosophila albomicans TaxID=7291 RepID=A0A6P8X700_DROAB|nr:uncharacterized protein LOC117570935 isoform X1 [Drosophila albomicans]
METCGFIISKGSDLESFLMRCSYCTIDVAIDQWHEFVLHFRTTHGATFKDTTNQLKKEEIMDEDHCIQDKSLDVAISEKEIETELKALIDADVTEPASPISNGNEYESGENAPKAESEQDEEVLEGASSYLPTNQFDPSFYRRDVRTLTFIESYKNQPCLWNRNDSKYMDPAACKTAYGQLRSELKTNIGVIFTDHSLRAAIKKLQMQYNAIHNIVLNGSQKEDSIPFSHYTRCAFLKASTESSRPPSSLSESSSSENESMETGSNAESEENEDKDEGSSYLPTNKFNPSFFRRDVRTLTFIEAYKSQPCLWDIGDSKYKDLIARRAAYRQLITELETSIAVVFTEHSLKVAIKKLHTQYNTVGKRVSNGIQKPNSVPFNHYTRCAFLKASGANSKNSFEIGLIQLNFSKKNTLTTNFIRLYSNYPQLYDDKHKDFSKMDVRKKAYDEIKAATVASIGDVSSNDIYLAIQGIRQWNFKSTKHVKEANEAELFYLKACDFLPNKTLKQKLICEICQQETSSDHVLQVHMHKVHNIGDLPFKCPSCERRFVARSEMATHMQRVHIGKTHKCNYCERSFAVNSDLRVHMRTHTGNSILCELCGKAFRLKYQLKAHITAIHTKIRAFKCTMCPKDFIKKVDLKDHIKSHLNIRDKICSTCGKGFTSCHSLIRHRQIHSDIKKFVCKLCDARFSQFVGLNSHMKRTHNIVRNSAQKSAETIVADETAT